MELVYKGEHLVLAGGMAYVNWSGKEAKMTVYENLYQAIDAIDVDEVIFLKEGKKWSI